MVVGAPNEVCPDGRIGIDGRMGIPLGVHKNPSAQKETADAGSIHRMWALSELW
jgi:hypothetical protein